MRFRKGDRLVLVDSNGIAAKKGAKVIVFKGTFKHSGFGDMVGVEWVDGKACGQMDGEYEAWRFVKDEVWKARRKERKLVI
ncbi:hypothetical protein GTO27_03415 [Candidatus Bathyarchaeota archaeon]|nr:hypothetical protein [Candidatus Bathyarchaeota archaeon]